MTGTFDLLQTPLAPAAAEAPAAAAAPNGTLLLEASAGTGKTYAITGIVLRLLLEEPALELPQVLVVTFTIAAAEELKTRLRRALWQTLAACEGQRVADPLAAALGRRHGEAGAARLRRALAAADQLAVATIHGFCKRVLDECAFESGAPFRTEFVENELPLLADATRDAVRLCLHGGDPLRAAVASCQGLLPDDLLDEYVAYRRGGAHVALRPEPMQLDAALAELRRHVDAARDAFDEPALAKLVPRLPFRKGAPSPVRRFGFVAQLRQRLADRADAPLDLLLALAPDRLLNVLNTKNRPPLDLPLLLACGDVQRALPAAEHALRAALFAATDERLLATKARHRVLTFQDLLEHVHGSLQDPRRRKALLDAVRTRWRAALIDEFQDTDPLQYEIFAHCFEGRPLFLVGDPKQSIYGFRGADVHAYLRARRDARATYTLGHNHRSHPQLVAAVGALFAAPAAFALAGIAMPAVAAALDPRACALSGDDGAALQLRWLPPSPVRAGFHQREYVEHRVVQDVGDEIVRLLAGGVELDAVPPQARRALAAGDVAVLTRTNAQAVAMQDELRRRGVHSAIGRAGDVFRCPEMDDMQRLLAAIASGGHLPALRAAWSTPLWGMSIADLRALDDDADRLAAELARADALRRTWVRHGFVVMFEDLLHETAGRQRLLQRADGERKLTNYLQIAELLHHAEHGRSLAPESLVLWLEHERQHAHEIDYQLRELRLESDADAVQILTVHGSKGLQYEVVFVPFAFGGARPIRGPVLVREQGGGHVYDCRSADGGQDRTAVLREELAENLRLCYVALTRARRRCYVHWVPCNGAHGSALAWLLHGPGRDPQADPAGLPAGWEDDVKQRVRHWRTELDALVQRAAGAIAVTDLPAEQPAGPRPARRGAAVRATADARPLPDRARPRSTIQSFTSLVQRDRSAEPVLESDEPEPGPAAPDAGGETAVAAAAAAGAAGTAPAGIFAFARGARAGVCLHEILEHTDFTAAGGDAERESVQRRLRWHRLADPAAHVAPIDAAAVVVALLARLRNERLAPLPFRLADLRASAPEWQFFLAAGSLRAHELAPLFAQHGGPALQPYAERLRSLAPSFGQGFLRGFVDLVAEHDGRWWVFDWKSNWLGDRAADYGADRLRADMQQNDYVLQYHLYLLALHRHLRARLPDYDYDRHVGGACYVYLRGLAGGDGDGSGVHVDRPPRPLLEALDDWLRGDRR